jgi:hypothetical protein
MQKTDQEMPGKQSKIAEELSEQEGWFLEHSRYIGICHHLESLVSNQKISKVYLLGTIEVEPLTTALFAFCICVFF